MRTLTKHKTVLVVALTAVSLTIWAILLYQPTQRRIETTRVQAAALDQEVNAAQRFLIDAAQIIERDGWLRQRQDLLTNLCRVDSLEVFFKRLEAELNRFGVRHTEFAPDLNELLKDNRIPFGDMTLIGGKFQMHCQGRFLSIGKALEYLEQQPYFVDMYSLSIAYNDATNPDVLCTMNFAVYLRDQEATYD